MSRFFCSAVILLQLLCANAFALDLYKPSYVTALKDIYLINDPDYVGAEYYLVVNVGEADMHGPEGLSHFLEHLTLFSMLHKERGELSISVDENAFAYSLATVFYAHGETRKDTQRILQRFSDAFQPIKLDRKFMREERKIVEREFEVEVQQYPLARDYDEVQSLLFGSQHLGRSVIGNAQSIRSLSIDDAISAHSKYYNAGNASLYILGNINYASMAARIKSAFPPQVEVWQQPVRNIELNQKRNQDEVQRPDIFRERLIFKKAIEIPAQYDWAERLVLRDHLHEILSSSYPSGLRKALQFDAFLAADLEVELEFATPDILLLHIAAAPDFGVKLEDLAAELEAQLALVAENGVSRMTFYDLKNDTEYFYADLKNTPTDLHEYILNSLVLGAEPASGKQIGKAAQSLTHLDFDAMMQAIAAPSDTAVRYLRAKQ
jgi:predicted Zn-dependent peptidase